MSRYAPTRGWVEDFLSLNPSGRKQKKSEHAESYFKFANTMIKMKRAPTAAIMIHCSGVSFFPRHHAAPT
jgi:hypothetical protein